MAEPDRAGAEAIVPPVSVSARASAIAHMGLDLCNPVPSATVDAAVGALGPLAGARVLDVGGGKGELALRLLRAGAAEVTVVERCAEFAAAARSRLTEHGAAAVVAEVDARDWRPGPAYDVVCCVGSSHALADVPAQALPALRALVRDGGRVLLGEGFWLRAPDADYLAALGATADELTDLPGLRAAAAAAGLAVRWEAVVAEADWERYEAAWAGNLRRYADTHRFERDAPALRALADAGWDRYDRWGRTTLGFALIVATAH